MSIPDFSLFDVSALSCHRANGSKPQPIWVCEAKEDFPLFAYDNIVHWNCKQVADVRSFRALVFPLVPFGHGSSRAEVQFFCHRWTNPVSWK
jgi:hypothetical protein